MQSTQILQIRHKKFSAISCHNIPLSLFNGLVKYILVKIFIKVNSKYLYSATLWENWQQGGDGTVTFIERIRGLREDNDLTQTEIAEVLGTSQTMYARYERGANEMPIHHLITLCKYYNVSADYLLDTTPSKLRKQKKKPAK